MSEQVSVSVSASPVPALTEEQRATLDKRLGPTVAHLVVNFPTRDDLRGIVLKACGLWVPEDNPDIAGFVLANVPPNPPPAPAPANKYEVRGSYTEEVTGRARFTRTDIYEGRVRWTNNDLRTMLEGLDREAAEEAIRESVQSNNEFDCTSSEDGEYDDHEVLDSEGTENWSFEGIDAVLDAFYDANPDCDPDREDEPEPEEDDEEPEEEEEDQPDEEEDADGTRPF